jgi:hypothetical protein
VKVSVFLGVTPCSLVEFINVSERNILSHSNSSSLKMKTTFCPKRHYRSARLQGSDQLLLNFRIFDTFESCVKFLKMKILRIS